MPNHVYQRLKFVYHDDKGEMLKSIIDTLKSEDRIIDFNKIVPQPKPEWKTIDWMCDEEYHWNIENWGTKWNAYDAKITVNNSWALVIEFQTAWSYPKPILLKLLELFPKVEMRYVCADDGGWFAYHIQRDSDSELTVKEWIKENDENGIVRSAMFEALNTSY